MDIYNLANILALSEEPTSKNDFDKWVEQGDVVPFLEREFEDENVIVYASLPYTFIHAILVPNILLDKAAIQELSHWKHNPYSIWSVVASSEDVWVDKPLAGSGSKTVGNGEQIIFARTFDGDNSRARYFELNQKIAQVMEVHFVAERNAWCKVDELGDIQDIVKVQELKNLRNNQTGTIISMAKDTLAEYATLCNYCVYRTFDFTRYKTGSFSDWESQIQPQEIGNGKDLFGRLVVQNGYGSYSIGFQFKDIRIPRQRILDQAWGRSRSEENKKYVTFIAYDWKNHTIAEISCAPSALASYFVQSDLPFETTPAFFKPEVLLKYKSDREKYQLGERSISCRGAWGLQSFDVNEAGQVHAYLTDLGRLPYEEQLHWKQFNERPKAPLSDRAIMTDFKGEWYEGYDPLASLKHKLEELRRAKVGWWTLRSQDGLSKVQYPYTSSRDEWAEEILNLDQLVIEGFDEKWLRQKVKDLGGSPEPTLRALKLIEECLVGAGLEEYHAYQLMTPFHDIHNARSVLKGHASYSEAEDVKKQALQMFGSFRKHFEDLCTKVDENLEVLIDVLGRR